jgi:hypothetical protein
MKRAADPARIPMAPTPRHQHWICEEAIMLAIALKTCSSGHLSENVRERLKAIVAVCSGLLDAFVSDRIRAAAAEAEHARPRRNSIA